MDLIAGYDTFLYGRKVYGFMASYWPVADRKPSPTRFERAHSPIWRETPKYVLSTTLENTGWNTSVIDGDVVTRVGELKQQPGKSIACFGGPGTAVALRRLGLVDDLRLFTHPVLLGGGSPLFDRTDDRTALTLVESRTFGPTANVHYRLNR